MIVSAPGIPSGRSNSIVELVDLYPTLADLCGLPLSDELEGRSLRPLLVDPDASSWTKPAITQVWHSKKAWGYSLRTNRYRYTEWLEGRAGRELYDHLTDPNEVHNLANLAEHSQTVAKLSNQLKPFVRLKPHKRQQ